MSREAIQHYEAALKEAFPRGATGDVFHHWNEARKIIANEALDRMAENAGELGLDYDDSVVGTKTWFDGEKVVTQELKHSDVYKQPADDPVACHHKRYTVDVNEQTGTCHDCGAEGRMQFVVNKARLQPAAQWVELTDEEINKLRYKKDWTAPWTDMTFARAIEAKLKEKNS